MMKRKIEEYNVNLLTIKLLFLFFMFIIIVLVISTPNFKINIFKNQDYVEIINSEAITNALLLLMAEEVPQFKDFVERKMEIPPISELAFESITGIKTNNISTLLLNEIPGFNSTTTKIYIAGEGSDYSNLPNKISPTRL